MHFRHRLITLFFIVFAALSIGACTGAGSGASEVKSADGTTIKYDKAGKGDVTLVFIHCWTCNRTFWDQQVKFFSPDYQVVRLDLAGHGESGKERKVYTIPAFGADVAAVVNDAKLQHVILVGHSMGGPVALEAAKLLGDKVIGIVGVDTFYTAFTIPKDPKAAKEMSAKFIEPFEKDFPGEADKFMRSLFGPEPNTAVVDRVANTSKSADKAVALSALNEVFNWYAQQGEASLKQFEDKLKNINGDPKREDKKLHKSVELLGGAGHFPAQETPEGFNRLLDRLVQDFIFEMHNKKE